MGIKEALYRYLQTVTALTDLVSTRIFRSVVPEDTDRPYIYYFVISADPNITARLNTDFFQNGVLN